MASSAARTLVISALSLACETNCSIFGATTAATIAKIKTMTTNSISVKPRRITIESPPST
jgi:hypothetical protein